MVPIGWWVWACLLAPVEVPAQAGGGPRNDPDLPAVSGDRTRMLDAYFASAVVQAGSKNTGGAPGHPEPRAPHAGRRSLPSPPKPDRHALDLDTAEVRAHQTTEQYRRAMTDIRRVKRAFSRSNPGYILVADTNARSLRVQVTYWNREPSVAAAAEELQDSCAVWLSDDSNADRSDSVRRTRFLDRLASYAPARLPTVAVPGLSLHGQIRAIDFAILRGGSLVAGTAVGDGRLGLEPWRVD